MDLRANTQVIVPYGPIVDIADGFTMITTLDITTVDSAMIIKHGTTAGIDVSGRTDGAFTADAVDGMRRLTLTTTDTNAEGNLLLVIEDVSLNLPIVKEFKVLSEAAYDSKYAPKDDGFMDVNIKTIGQADTTETEADNCQAFFGATGWVGGTAKLTVDTTKIEGSDATNQIRDNSWASDDAQFVLGAIDGMFFRVGKAMNLRLNVISGTMEAGWSSGIDIYSTDDIQADDWNNTLGKLAQNGTWTDEGGSPVNILNDYITFDVAAGSTIQGTDFIVALEFSDDGTNYHEKWRWNFKGVGPFSAYLKADGGFWYPTTGGIGKPSFYPTLLPNVGIGTDGFPLISTDAQDLSGSFIVDAAASVWNATLSTYYQAGTTMTKAATFMKNILAMMGWYKKVTDTGDATIVTKDTDSSTTIRTQTETVSGDEKTYTGS